LKNTSLKNKSNRVFIPEKEEAYFNKKYYGVEYYPKCAEKLDSEIEETIRFETITHQITTIFKIIDNVIYTRARKVGYYCLYSVQTDNLYDLTQEKSEKCIENAKNTFMRNYMKKSIQTLKMLGKDCETYINQIHCFRDAQGDKGWSVVKFQIGIDAIFVKDSEWDKNKF
jgi:hypothetical protein